jgi:hypothetical protein
MRGNPLFDDSPMLARVALRGNSPQLFLTHAVKSEAAGASGDGRRSQKLAPPRIASDPRLVGYPILEPLDLKIGTRSACLAFQAGANTTTARIIDISQVIRQTCLSSRILGRSYSPMRR